MRLLVFGHVSHTGFGVVTDALATRFLEFGIDVRVIAVNHRGEPIKGPLAGRVWPAAINGDAFGASISAAAIAGPFWRKLDPDDDWKPDIVLVVADMSGLAGHIGERSVKDLLTAGYGPWASLPVFHYCPIEGDNLDPTWAQVWQRIRPVAMSDFGQSTIAGLIGKAVPRIYHGVDTVGYHPAAQTAPIPWKGVNIRTRDDAKRAFGLDPKRLLVFRSDRLVARKFYDRLLTTMVRVFAEVPNVDLMIHCRAIDDGLSLHDEIARLPQEYIDRVMLTNAHDTWTGLPQQGMAALFNAADLYVSTTGGEGFGLNLAESLACGTPVVVTDWAADAEVIGPGGVAVPPLHDSYGEPVRYHSTYGMDWAVPDPRAFAVEIVRLLSKPATRKAMGQAGRLHVERSFSWDEAAASFVALFEDANAGSARLAS